MSKNLSAKYYEDKKRKSTEKKLNIKVFLKKKMKKSDNMS